MIALSLLLRMARAVTPRAWMVVGALAGVLILVTYCSHRAAVEARDELEAKNAAAALAAERRNAAANALAADERMADDRSTRDHQQELSDAVDALPDAVPSDRRVALACQRMRANGLDVSGVAACQRLARGAQAPAVPG